MSFSSCISHVWSNQSCTAEYHLFSLFLCSSWLKISVTLFRNQAVLSSSTGTNIDSQSSVRSVFSGQNGASLDQDNNPCARSNGRVHVCFSLVLAITWLGGCNFCEIKLIPWPLHSYSKTWSQATY